MIVGTQRTLVVIAMCFCFTFIASGVAVGATTTRPATSQPQALPTPKFQDRSLPDEQLASYRKEKATTNLEVVRVMKTVREEMQKTRVFPAKIKMNEYQRSISYLFQAAIDFKYQQFATGWPKYDSALKLIATLPLSVDDPKSNDILNELQNATIKTHNAAFSHLQPRYSEYALSVVRSYDTAGPDLIDNLLNQIDNTRVPMGDEAAALLGSKNGIPVEKEYDRFKNATTVSTKWTELTGTKGDTSRHNICVSATYEGEKPRPVPMSILITSISKEWRYLKLRNESMLLIIDDARTSIPMSMHDSDVGDYSGGHCFEFMAFALRPSDIQTFTKAKRVELQLGSNEFVLNPAQIQSFGNVWQQLSPPDKQPAGDDRQ